ncbi:MAG TPA: ROK family protein [Isosphaeraceae bacterium]|jgi:glucokinase|nr:ROK family protein [Isosphaeraceae bacterium]
MEFLFLGIEIGGTKLQLGLGHGDGRLLARSRLAVNPASGGDGIRRQIALALEPLLAQVGAQRSALAAAGIGFGGPVDVERGIVITSNQIKGWDRFPLADWVREELGIRAVALQNDADTAGLGEALFGAGAGLSPVLYVTVGSGIGGGLIIDGQIYRGSGRGAMEIGHLWVEAVPEPKTLEQVASGWSIGGAGGRVVEEAIRSGATRSLLAELADGSPERISSEIVAKAAARGDPAACEILNRATSAMARALAHAVTLLTPRRIILGGGVSLMSPKLWLEPIRAQLNPLVFPPFRDGYDLTGPSLGEEVVVHGALALAHQICS